MFSAVFVTGEEVEACAAGAEQDDVARFGERCGCLDGLLCGACIDYPVFSGDAGKCGVDLSVVDSEADDGLDLFTDEVLQDGVVVALVLAADNPDDGFGLAFERVPRRVDIGGLGVVDVEHVFDAQDRLQAVLDGLEGSEGLADDLVVDVHRLGGEGCCHRVVDVVASAEGEFLEIDLGLVFPDLEDDLVVTEECSFGEFLLLGEGELLAAKDNVVKVADGDFIVVVEDEAVVLGEVLGDLELRPDIVLEIVVVTVEVVWGDVGDDGDVRLEVVDVVELETADFQDIIVVLLGRDLICVGLPYIAAEADVEAGVGEEVIYKGSGRGLAVGAGDADLFRAVVTRGELDLGNYMLSGGAQFLYKGGRLRDARALDDLVGTEDEILAVATLALLKVR